MKGRGYFPRPFICCQPRVHPCQLGQLLNLKPEAYLRRSGLELAVELLIGAFTPVAQNLNIDARQGYPGMADVLRRGL